MPFAATPQALAIGWAVLREVIGPLTYLTGATVDINAVFVLGAGADEVPSLTAGEAHGKLEIRVRFFAVACGVVLRTTVVARLLAARAALGPALSHATITQGVSDASASEADEFAVPCVRRSRGLTRRVRLLSFA